VGYPQLSGKHSAAEVLTRRSGRQGEQIRHGSLLHLRLYHPRPLHGERPTQNVRQANERAASANAAGIVRTVADYLALGTEYGVLQANCVYIWFVATSHGHQRFSLGSKRNNHQSHAVTCLVRGKAAVLRTELVDNDEDSQGSPDFWPCEVTTGNAGRGSRSLAVDEAANRPGYRALRDK
jgi:hypothetical protein